MEIDQLKVIIDAQELAIKDLQSQIAALAVKPTSLSIQAAEPITEKAIITVGKETYQVKIEKSSVLLPEGGAKVIDLKGADDGTLKETLKAYPNLFTKL